MKSNESSSEFQNGAIQDGTKCPIAFALETFGDKWSLLIIRDMVFKKKRHYGEFLNSPEGISTNILADRLAKMEEEGLISKARDDQNHRKNIYRLTQKGKALLPMLLEMIAWSATYDPQPDVPDSIIIGAPPDLLHRSQSDRTALIEEILANMDDTE